MIAQLRKELKVYFSGILGYLIIGIYLLINGVNAVGVQWPIQPA